MVGIISNSAALFAQRNLQSASTQSQSSISRLSSGNKIVKASDDVAGLAIGTTLATTVSSLRTVLSSTAQAGSLLSIADGGLQNIGDILQRQKSLAVQANTGSLSDNERAFLDQEFQNLVLEIDRLVTNTNFNGVSLLDGGISGNANVTTATGATTETYSINNIADFGNAGTFTSSNAIDAISFAGDITTANTNLVGVIELGGTIAASGAGVTITFGGDTALSAIAVTSGDTQATAEDIAQALNASTGTDASKFNFSVRGGNQIIITSIAGGTANNAITIAIANDDTGLTLRLNGNAAGAADADIASTALSNTPGNGSAAGVAEVTNAAGNTVFNTNLQGAITGLTSTFTAGTDLTNGDYVQNSVTFSAIINGETYVSDSVLLSGIVQDGAGATTNLGDTLNDNTTLIFRKAGEGTTGATFRLTTNGAQTITNQATATTAATLFQTGLTSDNIAITQSRELASFDGSKLSGSNLEGLADADILLTSDAFSTAGTLGSISAFNFDRLTDKITVSVNDVVYTADLTANDSTSGGIVGGTGAYNTSTGVFSSLNTGSLLTFVSATANDASTLTIDLGSLTATTFTINDAAQETAFESALASAFGTGSTASLTFQVGTSSTDSIGLALSSAKTTDIYKDGTGTVQTLAVSTAAGAITASDVLDNAITTITSLRSTIGGLQSRFNFAAANIQSSIQNTEAARSNFLDTDIAAESTNFATAQVRLQASISVLAQANQLPQNLLKLIG